MYKQVIIARKDLDMSPGKLAAQVSHASMAFLTSMIRRSSRLNTKEKPIVAYNFDYDENDKLIKMPKKYLRKDLTRFAKECTDKNQPVFYVKRSQNGEIVLCEPTYYYTSCINFDKNLYEQWFNGSFTKCVLQAKNKNQLLKAKTVAEELGMKEGEDFFLIRDECRTELDSEDADGRTLTCIGFKPMDSEIIDKIGKKYHLYM